jgi:hypothetical protein
VRVFARFLLGILLFLIASCAVIFYRVSTRYTSVSPDGKHAIRFGEKCAFDCMIHIDAEGDWPSREIALGNDCTSDFLHVAWFGPVAAIFVQGGACPDIKIAYSFQQGQRIDFTAYEPRLKEDIVSVWRVTPEELASCGADLLVCVSDRIGYGERVRREFSARHPRTGFIF